MMDEKAIGKLWTMTEEELEEKYQEILMGMDAVDLKQTSDPTVKTVHDAAEHSGASERKKFLLTIIIQHKMINELREQMAEDMLTRPVKVDYDPSPQKESDDK